MFDKFWDIIVWLCKKLPHFYTILPNEAAVVTRFGRYVKTLYAGGHYRFHWPVIHSIIVIDVKRQLIDIDMQDIMTSDMHTICLNASIEYVVANPAIAILEVNEYDKNLQEIGGDVFRRAIMSRTLDECVKGIEGILLEVFECLDKKAEKEYGIDVLEVLIPTFTSTRTIRLIQ